LNNSASTGQIFMELDIWGSAKNLLRKFKFHSNLTRVTGTLCEYLCTFVIIALRILLRMRNVSDKICRENKNRHFRLIFFHKLCRLWDNVEKYGKARLATDGNMVQKNLICMMDNEGKNTHTHTLIIFNSYWFSTATMVMQVCHSVICTLPDLLYFIHIFKAHYHVEWVSLASDQVLIDKRILPHKYKIWGLCGSEGTYYVLLGHEILLSDRTNISE